jgi:hypothetical protein
MLRCPNLTTKDVRSAAPGDSLLYNLILCFKKCLRRDAREAEGARLEIVYSANNGIEGSTPSLSAMLVTSSESGVRSLLIICSLKDDYHQIFCSELRTY